MENTLSIVNFNYYFNLFHFECLCLNVFLFFGISQNDFCATDPLLKMDKRTRKQSPERQVRMADDQMVFDTTDGVKVIHSFEEFGLKEDLLRGIYAYSTLNNTRSYHRL